MYAPCTFLCTKCAQHCGWVVGTHRCVRNCAFGVHNCDKSVRAWLWLFSEFGTDYRHPDLLTYLLMKNRREKKLTLASHLLRSHKVIETNTDRSATYMYDFLWVINIVTSLSRTVSEINGDFSQKSQIFFHRRVFNAAAEGVPIGIS